MAEEIRDLTEIIKESCEQKGLEFNVILSSDLESDLFLDLQRVKQVLMNLAMNAIKFTLTGFVHVTLDYDHE